MGFMDPTFYGYAKKFIVGSRCFTNIFTELNLKNGEFNLYIPEQTKRLTEPLVATGQDLQRINKSNLWLEDVEIFTSLLRLSKGKVGQANRGKVGQANSA